VSVRFRRVGNVVVSSYFTWPVFGFAMAYTAAENTCIAFLVRHASTINNLARPPKLQGLSEDEGLSAEGEAEAETTARFLSDQPISRVFSSPLARAMETAAIIARPHGLTPTLIQPFHEVDVGRWAGRTWASIERDEPDAYHRFMTDPARHGYSGGENMTQVRERVLPAAMKLLEENLGRVILVVGHNVVNRVLLATVLHVPLSKARGIDQDNCGVSIIRYRNGQTKLLTSNAAFHLH